MNQNKKCNLSCCGSGFGKYFYQECEDCEGTGEVISQAHQSGGDIVDETTVPCHCTK